MRAKLTTAFIVISAAFAISGCDPDKSGETQAPKKPAEQTTSQMPRSKEEAQKMFGNGGSGAPVAPKSNNGN